MSAAELLPAGPQAATAVLRDLADAPESVRYAVGGELLYALRILPRPAPATTECLACYVQIPAGEAWCSWRCRNLDDRHDDGDWHEDGDA